MKPLSQIHYIFKFRITVYREMLGYYIMQSLAESTWPSYRELRITSTKLKKTFDLQ